MNIEEVCRSPLKMDQISGDEVKPKSWNLNDDCVSNVFDYMNISDLAKMSKINDHFYNLVCASFKTKRFDSMWVKILLRGVDEWDMILKTFGHLFRGVKMNFDRYTALPMLECFIRLREVAFMKCVGVNLRTLDLRFCQIEPRYFYHLCENAPELRKLKMTRISGSNYVRFTNKIIKEHFPKLEELIVDEDRLKVTQDIFKEHRCLRRIGIAVTGKPTQELRRNFPDIEVVTYYVMQKNQPEILDSIKRMVKRNKLKKITLHFEVYDESDDPAVRDEFYMSLFRPLRSMTHLRTLKLCNTFKICKYFPQIAECFSQLEEFHFNTNAKTNEDDLVEFVRKSTHLQRIFVPMYRKGHVNIERLYERWSLVLATRDVKRSPLEVFWKTDFCWMAKKVRGLRGKRLKFHSLWHSPLIDSEQH